MSLNNCLCSKLREKVYDRILPEEVSTLTHTSLIRKQPRPPPSFLDTELDYQAVLCQANILRTTYHEAPDLFEAAHRGQVATSRLQTSVVQKRKHPNPDNPSATRKRCRTFGNGLSLDVEFNRPISIDPAPIALPSISKQVELLLSKVCLEGAEDILKIGGHLPQLDAFGTDPAFVRITRICAITEQLERRETTTICQQRILYCALAAEISASASHDRIVTAVENALPHLTEAKVKIRKWVHVGKRWATIFEEFGNCAGYAPTQVSGLLCILRSLSI